MFTFRTSLSNFFKSSVNTPIFRKFSSKVGNFTCRTHTCGELRLEHAGNEVTLCGWILHRRCDKFLIIRDSYGNTQAIFDERNTAVRNFVTSLPLESVVEVTGEVMKRPLHKVNSNMSTGEIEVLIKDVKLLSSGRSDLPFVSRDYQKVTEAMKQKYRYLAIRMKSSQEILRSRSRFVMKMRKFLHDDNGFVEVETPTLFKKTPGGAKEFIVPTKFPGHFYSLVQSPQQFKQLLMVGGLDRYFQIARCYRNETINSNRQPEFTQVDLEVSFTSEAHIRSLVEQLLLCSWPQDKGKIQTPFPCMTYADAMTLYGTDKPDIRFDMKLNDVTDLLLGHGINIFDQLIGDSDSIISAVVIPSGSKAIKKAMIKEYKENAKEFDLPNLIDIHVKDDTTWNSFLAKLVPAEVQSRINERLNLKPNDLVMIAAGKAENVNEYLGKVRVRSAEQLRVAGIDIGTKSNSLAFLWVTDFPLFMKSKAGVIESAHHPFTAPRPEHIDAVFTEPLKALGQHYDLVLNGHEVGGGSIRIHDSFLQRYILEEVLKEDSSSLEHLLEALESGCPPHGGIALGVDRLMAIMHGCNTISEVIAFPKSGEGKDLMSGAPTVISEEDQLAYHIEAKIPEKTEHSHPPDLIKSVM